MNQKKLFVRKPAVGLSSTMSMTNSKMLQSKHSTHYQISSSPGHTNQSVQITTKQLPIHNRIAPEWKNSTHLSETNQQMCCSPKSEAYLGNFSTFEARINKIAFDRESRKNSKENLSEMKSSKEKSANQLNRFNRVRLDSDFSIQNTKSEKQMTTSFTSIKKLDLLKDSGCNLCQNNKKIAQLLRQKNMKLEEQLNQKLNKIIEISMKIENMKIDESNLKMEQSSLVSKINLKEVEFHTLRVEWEARFHQTQRDLIKMTEQYKYLEIENSMLHRYKDQYELITYEYKKLSQENHYLRKNRRDSKKEIENFNHLNFAKQKIKQDKLSYSSQRHSQEDDDISLDFSSSERSFDHD